MRINESRSASALNKITTLPSPKDPTRKAQFVVYEDFDLDGDGIATAVERERLESMITRWGGIVVPEVNKETDYVVVGARPTTPAIALGNAGVGPDQYDNFIIEAKRLSIPVLNADRFLHMIGASPATAPANRDSDPKALKAIPAAKAEAAPVVPAQVLIKALVATVDAKSFDQTNAATQPAASQPAGTAPASAEERAAQAAIDAVITEGSLQNQLMKLAQDSKLEVLARPYILAQSGQLAAIRLATRRNISRGTRRIRIRRLRRPGCRRCSILIGGSRYKSLPRCRRPNLSRPRSR